MKKLMSYLLDRAKGYTILDYAVFKITLVSLGVILGMYFAQFFASFAWAIWTIFAVCYVIIMYRTFRK